MHEILSVLSGSAAGAFVVWLLQGWISERLKQSIQHEYSHELQKHKADLDSKILVFQHEYKLQQIRTSLFFDHQRTAFALILNDIAEVNKKWLEDECHDEDGITGPVPNEVIEQLRKTYQQHVLFLDTNCAIAMDLIMEIYNKAMSSDEDEHIDDREFDALYQAVEYIRPRLTEMFQNRIGMCSNGLAEREIALLGSMRILNSFSRIGAQYSGNLKLVKGDSAADLVEKASSNYDELCEELKKLREYLKESDAFFHESTRRIEEYLSILTTKKDASNVSIYSEGKEHPSIESRPRNWLARLMRLS
jgi:hypothetical protein